MIALSIIAALLLSWVGMLLMAAKICALNSQLDARDARMEQGVSGRARN